MQQMYFEHLAGWLNTLDPAYNELGYNEHLAITSKYFIAYMHFHLIAVADLRGRREGQHFKFFQFHAVFGKIWQKHMLAPPWRVGTPIRHRIDYNVKKFNENEHPATTSAFVCIKLFVISGTQCNWF